MHGREESACTLMTVGGSGDVENEAGDASDGVNPRVGEADHNRAFTPDPLRSLVWSAFSASADSGVLCAAAALGEEAAVSDLMPSCTMSRLASALGGDLARLLFGGRSGDNAEAEQNDQTSTLAQSKLDAPPWVKGSLLNVSD